MTVESLDGRGHGPHSFIFLNKNSVPDPDYGINDRHVNKLSQDYNTVPTQCSLDVIQSVPDFP